MLMRFMTSPENARRLVREYKERGFDLIKAYGYLDDEVYKAIKDEASILDFPVAKHGPAPVEGLELDANRGLQSLEHVEDIFQGSLNFTFDSEALKAWVAEFKIINPTVTPTLATFHHLTQLSDRKSEYVEEQALITINPLYRLINREFDVNRWLNASPEHADWNKKEELFLFEIVRELDNQNIPLLVGSDGGTMYMAPGVSTHLEIALLHKAGLSPVKVLQAATLNAATALGVADDYGSISEGKVADLLIVEDNPLNNLKTLSQPLAVVKAGQWLGEEELSYLRKSGEKPSNFYISLGRLLEDILVRKFMW